MVNTFYYRAKCTFTGGSHIIRGEQATINPEAVVCAEHEGDSTISDYVVEKEKSEVTFLSADSKNITIKQGCECCLTEEAA